MKTTEIVSIDGKQAVKLPAEFSFSESTVSIRRQGESVILEPIKAAMWPMDFFERIRVEDASLSRPPQGIAPPAPNLDSR
ncbi:MAG: AbrB/MazE/SpoVT family DNA-binding domain-containing protein [Planctomycetes bacterium]|nr:AbrB/MazE/SpoVT family DNA-binding domain-containing protein [Planctomycetota bacterium]